jgi:hypothetical protein
MENKETPFYVVLSCSGPNNTSHPNSTKTIHYNEKGHEQYFKIIEIEKGGWSSTYRTEDGYYLWSECVKEIAQQEYEQNRGVVGIQEALIFN